MLTPSGQQEWISAAGCGSPRLSIRAGGSPIGWKPSTEGPKCNALFVGRLLSRDCSLCRREPRSSTTELCLLLQSSR